MKISDSGPWAISVRTPKQSITKVITRESIDETLEEVLTRTKQFAKAIREKYKHRDDIIVEIISRNYTFEKPQSVKLKGNQLWCPYCAKPRRFIKGMRLAFDGIEYTSDVRCCEVCTISDNDYYVKTYNDLWPKDLNLGRRGK